MDLQSERRYAHLKSQLNALNYNQPFGIESVPLIDKLVGDLVVTTESFEALRKKSSRRESAMVAMHNQLYPLRRENARLVRENNQLHMDLIRQSEEQDKREQGHTVGSKKLAGEVSDLKFLLAQKEATLRGQEKEILI